MSVNSAQKYLRFNIAVNLLDGGFFGFAIGFASFVTIIPLFVSKMTDSAILIGLIPAIHNVGWQLPQLFTAQTIARQKRLKPLVLLATTQERLPFLGLALVAWFFPKIGASVALPLTFALLVWQGLGGGFTANPWQNLIAKIMPANLVGTFYGLQSASANLFFAASAAVSGVLLERFDTPLDFTLCFGLASAALVISWFLLSLVREEAAEKQETPPSRVAFWSSLPAILRRDAAFRVFLAVRIVSQFAVMASAFYTVYAVQHYKASESAVGIMASVLAGVQILANPIMGRLGDRIGHRPVMAFGVAAAGLSALLAWLAPAAGWFYLVFILTGIAAVAMWTIAMAMTLEFGNEAERPAYVGMANTLIAPFTFICPLLGGWLADAAGYPAAFIASIAGSAVTLLMIVGMMKK